MRNWYWNLFICSGVRRKRRLRFFALLLPLLGVLSGALPARAQSEVEADPVAFALQGYSVHAAEVIHANNRLQLGSYGYEIPKFFGGNGQFTRRGNGVTLKYDRFFGHETRGFFVGADADFTRTRYTLDSTRQRTYRNDFTVGPRFGYRFEIGPHLYVTPWLSCGYVFNPGPPVVVAGQKFDRSSFGFFPTVHIGWRFRSVAHRSRPPQTGND